VLLCGVRMCVGVHDLDLEVLIWCFCLVVVLVDLDRAVHMIP
jgi:hypothetical protein